MKSAVVVVFVLFGAVAGAALVRAASPAGKNESDIRARLKAYAPIKLQADLSQLGVRPGAPVRWFIEVGRFEGLLESNRAFRRILESRGYSVTYKEWQAGHNWTHWGDALADALPELFRNVALPAAAEGGCHIVAAPHP